MYNERRLLALHYNTSKKIGQLTKTVGNFLSLEAERRYQMEFIKKKDENSFSDLISSFNSSIKNIQNDWNQILIEIPKNVQQYFQKRIDSEFSFSDVETELKKIEKFTDEKIDVMKKEIDDLSQFLTDNILNYQNDLVQLEKKQLHSEITSKKENQIKQIGIIDKDFEKKNLEIEELSMKTINELTKKHEKEINSIKSEYLSQPKIDISSFLSKFNFLKKEIASQKENVLSFENENSSNIKNLISKLHQIIQEKNSLQENYKTEKNRFQQMSIDQENDFIKEKQSLENEKLLCNSKNQEKIQYLKQKHLEQIYQNNFQVFYLNCQIEFNNFYLFCYDQYAAFYQYIEYVKELSTINQRYSKLIQEQTLTEKKKIDEINNIKKSMNFDNLITQYNNEEKEKLEKSNQIFAEKIKMFNEEYDNQKINNENLLNQQLEKIQHIFVKQNEKFIPSVIISLQKQFNILESEYNKVLETNDPKLKSLDRQIASLESARIAAYNLKDKKKQEVIDDFNSKISDENKRHESKLNEIEHYDGKIEIQMLKNEIKTVKKDIEKIKKMHEDFYQYRIQEAEMIELARKNKGEAFVVAQEQLSNTVDSFQKEKEKLEKEMQNIQIQFVQDKKILEKRQKQNLNKIQSQIKETKKAGNSAISERKMEYMDKIDKIQVIYLELRDKIDRDNSAFQEVFNTKLSKFEVKKHDFLVEYEKQLEKYHNQLSGIIGLYQDKEDAARKKNFVAKASSESIPQLENQAEQLNHQLNSLIQQLSQVKRESHSSKSQENDSPNIPRDLESNIQSPLMSSKISPFNSFHLPKIGK